VFEVLEEKFYRCNATTRTPWVIYTGSLCDENVLNGALALGWAVKCPGFVSKFVVKIFVCSPPSEELKREYPQLAGSSNWTQIEDPSKIPPGFTLFTVWNEPGEFVPLTEPVGSHEQEVRPDGEKMG